MKRVMILLAALGVAGLAARAQEPEVLRAALYLSGASSEEEVDPDWVERLEARGAAKVRINDARPRAGGLLTEYQLASIADYRSRHGDILSWEELALVDGFSQEAVAALKPFLSLSSARLPGSTDTLRTHARALLRYGLKAVGGKLKAEGPSWRAGAAWRGATALSTGNTAGARCGWWPATTMSAGARGWRSGADSRWRTYPLLRPFPAGRGASHRSGRSTPRRCCGEVPS